MCVTIVKTSVANLGVKSIGFVTQMVVSGEVINIINKRLEAFADDTKEADRTILQWGQALTHIPENRVYSRHLP